MRKEKELSRQKKETYSLSAVIGEVKTLKSFLMLVEGLTCLFYVARWLTLPEVAAVALTGNPRLKTLNNGLIKTTTKTPYNGLSKLQLKYRIIDIINPECDFQCIIWEKMTVLKLFRKTFFHYRVHAKIPNAIKLKLKDIFFFCLLSS